MRREGKITANEEDKIDRYVKSNMPDRIGSTYGWVMYEWKPRYDWMRYQIKKLKAKQRRQNPCPNGVIPLECCFLPCSGDSGVGC